MGNLVVDAYRDWAKTDLALDQMRLIYGQFHEGNIRTVDAYNALPAIYNPRTGKSWTLKILPIRGSVLKTVFELLFTHTKLASMGGLSLSGARIVYDPILQLNKDDSPDPFFWNGDPEAIPTVFQDTSFLEDTKINIQEFSINGKELDTGKYYSVAISGGIYEALLTLNSIDSDLIPLNDLRETGAEDWKIVANYVSKITPLRSESIEMGRMRSVQPDLAVFEHDIQWNPISISGDKYTAQLMITVRNLGETATSGNEKILVSGHSDPTNTAISEKLKSLTTPVRIPSLRPGENMTLRSMVTIPGERGIYPVTIELQAAPDEVNLTNNSATHWFSIHQAGR